MTSNERENKMCQATLNGIKGNDFVVPFYCKWYWVGEAIKSRTKKKKKEIENEMEWKKESRQTDNDAIITLFYWHCKLTIQIFMQRR